MNIEDYKNRKYKDRKTNVVYTVYRVDGKTRLLHMISASGNTTVEVQMDKFMVENWERIF